MENELLSIFDDNRNLIGTATREEVHRLGYWHEVFHCWFVSKENNRNFILLQLRSPFKKDYPNLYDITAAGHLLAYETLKDGVREIKEELGIDITFEELQSLGVIDYCITKENFIDKELAHVFLYQCNLSFNNFDLQEEEVSGIVKMDLVDFKKLWTGEIETAKIEGFKIKKDGKREGIEEFIDKRKFVSHEPSYYVAIINEIIKKI